MSFTPDIPASGQTLGGSRLQVLNNFKSLRETISTGSGTPGLGQKPNHVDVNNGLGVGAGKHIFVEMPVQTTGPGNLPLANEGGMITRTLNGSSELYYARDGVNTYYQMTGPLINASSGSTVLFGGVIIKWGVSIAGNANVVFASAFLANCFGVTLTNQQSTISSGVTNVTTTGFTITGGVAGTTYFYVAIGN